VATIVITGTNRGIGLQFARQYAESGWDVVATCRDPARALELRALAATSRRLRIEALDQADPMSVAAFADRLEGLELDVLLHNAALLGPGEPQLLGQFDPASFDAHYRTNALGPLLLTQALLPALERGSLRKLVFLGSAAGATAMLQPPANLYAYRGSKAALHLMVRNLSIDLKPRGMVVALLNPGLVDTRGLLDLAADDPGPPDLAHLVKLVRAGLVPLIRASESVTGMRVLIDEWTLERTGQFLNYDGQGLPW
jgi:NAD(P)-dependent dehydrogenase (short-subunit alcohol dehydrogenase family)